MQVKCPTRESFFKRPKWQLYGTYTYRSSGASLPVALLGIGEGIWGCQVNSSCWSCPDWVIQNEVHTQESSWILRKFYELFLRIRSHQGKTQLWPFFPSSFSSGLLGSHHTCHSQVPFTWILRPNTCMFAIQLSHQCYHSHKPAPIFLSHYSFFSSSSEHVYAI